MVDARGVVRLMDFGIAKQDHGDGLSMTVTGQTLGKKWLGIKVVSTSGRPLTFGSHFVRGLVFGLLGIISAVFIFRADRRCLHDMAGETKVVLA